jgi:hypothetical protein
MKNGQKVAAIKQRNTPRYQAHRFSFALCAILMFY